LTKMIVLYALLLFPWWLLVNFFDDFRKIFIHLFKFIAHFEVMLPEFSDYTFPINVRPTFKIKSSL
jgi:hypothetical protein